MHVPVCRSRAGSSRADFCGVEPRVITPAPERRPSQLAGINRTLTQMLEEYLHCPHPCLMEEDDPPSLFVEGSSTPVTHLEIMSNNPPDNYYDIITVLFPWMQVNVKVTLNITLAHLKSQVFAKLQPMRVPGYSMETADYHFRMISCISGEMESFYLEELELCKLPWSRPYPMISLFPREGVHVEKEIVKQIGTIIGHSLVELDGELSDELKSCRARLWSVTCEAVETRGSGYEHYAFPEERIHPSEDDIPMKLMAKIEGSKRHQDGSELCYEVFYRSRGREDENSEETFLHVAISFEVDLTPATLIGKAVEKLRREGHEIDDEPFLLQLAGQKSYLTGNSRKLISYSSIRSLFGNYKSPKFVMRRESVVLADFPQPRKLIKPAYVLAHESRTLLEAPEPGVNPIPSIWSIDENLMIRPMSYSNMGAHHEHTATIVATFTFYVGSVVIRRLASKEISPRNPRWTDPAMSTGIYMKDIPECAILCVQLFEVRRERIKQKSFSKEKKEEDAVKRESESEKDEFRERSYGFSEKDNDMFKGWPEFLKILQDKEDELPKGEKKEERIVISSIGWVNISLFDWKRIMVLGTHSYNLWPGDAVLPAADGKLGQMELKPDGRQAHCRITLEVSTTVSNRHADPIHSCRCMDDDKWSELYDANQGQRMAQNARNASLEMAGLQLNDVDLAEFVNSLLTKRFLQATVVISEADQRRLWNSRHHIALHIPDGVILLMETQVMWEMRDNFGEIYHLMMSGGWSQISVPAAITILSSSNTDRLIRQFAANSLGHKLDDRTFPLFILPVIQALKRETWAFSDLTALLLKRALSDYRIGHKVFWLLRAELILVKDTVGPDNDLFRRIAVLVEAYLRGNEDYIPSICKQVSMVERISEMTTMVKNYNKDVATQKLQEELREKCTGMENIDSPLDPTAVLGELIIDKCKVLGSAKMPLRLCWRNVSPLSQHHLPTYEIIFKNGDDLRQDMLVLQVLEVMDNVWMVKQMDCCLSPYPVLPTGYKIGMIGVVPNSCTIFQIQSEGGKVGTAVKSLETTFLNKFLRSNSNAREYLESVDRFLMSCVGYSVATFIMGIKDRHNDNIMVSRDGRLFHIDFGHILGHGKKKLGIQRDRVPFVLVEHFLCVIGKGRPVSKDSHDVSKFRQMCIDAYCILWDSRLLFLSLFTAMQSMDLPELSTDEDLDHLKKTLQVSLDTREDAAKYFSDIFDEAFSGSWSTKTNWFFHTVKHM